jgi:CO/xanthine dehydrogenase Mo-binding subunit
MSRVIGQPRPLLDGPTKVSGRSDFVANMQRPGLLHARLVPSLYAHARLGAIDATAALAVDGVTAVLTAGDMPPLAASNRRRMLLARDRVVFAGQPVALVLAESEAAAQDGAALVQVDYEPLPAALTIDEALADGAPLVWPGGVPSGAADTGAHGADTGAESSAEAHSNVVKRENYQRGDLAAGFAAAAAIVERRYTTPWVHQTSLEPQAVLVEPDPLTGGARIWASTQGHFSVRKDVAEILGVPHTAVRVTPAAVGGAFGAKGGLYEPLVALAARATGRPVRLVLTRSEEMLAANPAPGARIDLKLGAAADGQLTAMQARVILDNGCYPFELAGWMSMLMASFYRVPNFHVEGLDVLTFKVSAGAYRAPGATSLTFALDSAMDELATQLNLDGLEFRLRNAARGGDTRADDKIWARLGMVEVLEALSRHPAWQNRQAARAAGRGVGIAVGGWPGGVEPAAAFCSLQHGGLFRIQVGSVDITGTTGSFALIAAEVLGVAPERIDIVVSDTDTAPYAGMSGGSKVTYTSGAAVAEAAREARRQVLEIASEELEAAAEDLEIVGDRIQVRGAPGASITLERIAERSMRYGGRYAPVAAQGRSVQRAAAPAFSAQLAEVEVDSDTGEVRVRRLVVAQDVGRAINPLMVQGQMLGGAAQGMGWALYEALLHDAGGQLVTGTLMEYAVPHITHAPAEFETMLVEVPSETGPFGARGVGEAPVVPTAAAIANAIADATGVRLCDLPMSAPRVVAALANGPARPPRAA